MWHSWWDRTLDRLRVVRSDAEKTALLHDLTSITSPTVLAFANVHAMNLIAGDETFFKAISHADILLRDGSGMAMLLRTSGREAGMNMNGTDFIPIVLKAYQGRRVALWGTMEPFLGSATVHSRLAYGVKIVSSADGFREDEFYLRLAKELRPDLIVLAMGMPKQERIAQAIQSTECGSPLIICGGAILDFFGGKVSRAPAWIRGMSLEWVYRLALEPRRLCRRYLIGVPEFMFRVALRRVSGIPR